MHVLVGRTGFAKLRVDYLTFQGTRGRLDGLEKYKYTASMFVPEKNSCTWRLPKIKCTQYQISPPLPPRFYLQQRAARGIANSGSREHSASLFAKLGILDIFQVNALQIAKYLCFIIISNYCLRCFLVCFLQVVKYTAMTQEQPSLIDHITVVLI